jgi:phosphoribosylglycinamide formyltransferase-1
MQSALLKKDQREFILPKTARIAVLVSGGGSNLEAILQAQESGELMGAEVALVLSSKNGAYALERARLHRVAAVVIERSSVQTDEAFERAILDALAKARIDLVCLAGYLRKLGPGIIRRYQGRILNIHPALLPKFGGSGMYGHFVHEAVIAAGEKESGCTVHVVDEEFDHGPILAQAKVAVLPDDTPESLAAKILEQEHRLYPKTISEFCRKLTPSGVRHD